MKTIRMVLLSILFISGTCSFSEAQDNIDFRFIDMMYGRTSGARVEALARSGVALTGDASAVYLNPALTATAESRGLFYTNRTSSYHNLTKKNNTHTGFGWTKVPHIGVLGFGWEHFRSNTIYTTYPDEPEGEFGIDHYQLNISRKLRPSLFAGVTVSHYRNKNIFWSATWAQPDVYRKIELTIESTFADAGIAFLKQTEGITEYAEQFSAGLTVRNILFSKGETKGLGSGIKSDIPVVATAGCAYTIRGGNNYAITGTFDLLYTVDPGNYRDALRCGLESTVFDLFSARLGYFRDFFDTKSPESGFTYGFGGRIPLQRLTGGKFPADLRIDAVRMEEDFGRYSHYELAEEKNFHVITLGIVYTK